MKKLIAIIIALAMFTTMAAAAGAGDVDNDGSVTVSDALSALRIAAQVDPYKAAADVDGDRTVTVADALQILRCAVGFFSQAGLSSPELKVNVTSRAASYGVTQAMVDRGMTNIGDTSRLVRLMRKARAGEEITIGFIGGSITVGGMATTENSRYTRVVEAWWKRTFPNTKINYVNAGYSGTPSLFGVHRLDEQLMYSEPDFVMIEFGVNDNLQDWQKEAYASLVRRILTADCRPAVMLFFMTNNDGSNAQSDQQPIGEFYDLPMVSERDAIWPEVKPPYNNGTTFAWEDIVADYVHPTDKGHAICGELINCLLQAVYDNLDTLSSETKPVREDVPLPYAYEHAQWLHVRNTTPVQLGGFTALTNSDYSWVSRKGNSDPLIIRYYGKRLCLAIKQEEWDTVKATYVIDGGDPVMLSGENLLIAAGQYAYFKLEDDAAPAWHTIEISCLENTMDILGLFTSW